MANPKKWYKLSLRVSPSRAITTDWTLAMRIAEALAPSFGGEAEFDDISLEEVHDNE